MTSEFVLTKYVPQTQIVIAVSSQEIRIYSIPELEEIARSTMDYPHIADALSGQSQSMRYTELEV